MKKDIKLKETNYIFSVKPNRLSVSAISTINDGMVDVYYELIYDHYEEISVPVPITIVPEFLYDTETGLPVPNPDYIEVLDSAPIFTTERSLKYSIVLFCGNERIPSQFLIPLLSNNMEATNQVLAGFSWGGPFSGLIMQLAEQ